MEFIICHETSAYMRLRLRRGRFSAEEAEVLEYALKDLKGVTKFRLYPASGGIALFYRGGRERRTVILRKLRAFRFRNVAMFARELEDAIDAEELSRRGLSPEVRDRLRRKVLLETAADILMPMPIQVGYHIYQLVTLKNL